MLDVKKFSPGALTGLVTWPGDVDETQGYVIYDKGLFDFIPVSMVDIFVFPESLRTANVIATFHSHPVGCTRGICYLQPPSLRDLRSFYTLSVGLKLPVHLVITREFIFFVKTFEASPARFAEMMTRFEMLMAKKNDPDVHQPAWLEISKQFPDVIDVKLIKNIK